MTPRRVSHADLALVGEALVAHEHDEAAGAVAALLDLAAVGIEDAIAKVGVAACAALDDAAPGRSPRRSGDRRARELRRVERELLARRVDDDEVVAGALHLRELKRVRHRGAPSAVA